MVNGARLRLFLAYVAIELFLENFFFRGRPNLFREHSLDKLNELLSSADMVLLESGLVAHSSYFQALAELGFFFGLFLALQMLITVIVLWKQKMYFCLLIVIYIFLLAVTMEYLTSPLLIAAIFTIYFLLSRKVSLKKSHCKMINFKCYLSFFLQYAIKFVAVRLLNFRKSKAKHTSKSSDIYYLFGQYDQFPDSKPVN